MSKLRIRRYVGMGRPLDALTGFRFVAAAHVLVLHESVDFLPDAGSWLNTMLLRTAAVSFFFVLSGFVLVQAYGATAWRKDSRRFAISRLARLYPLYALGLLLYAPFFLFDNLVTVQDGAAIAIDVAPDLGRILTIFATHVLLLQAWIPTWACTWNCPGWSVSATVFFALVFPLLCWLLRGRTPRTLWTVLAAGFALSQLGAWIYVHHTPMDLVAREIFHKNPLVRLPEFIIGVAAGFLWLQGRLQGRTLRHRAALPVLATGILALFLALPAPWSPYLHNGLLAPLFVALIAASILRGGRLGATLHKPRFQALGKASFAFYILHIPIARTLALLLWAATGTYPRWSLTFLLLDLLVVSLLAGPIYRRVEEPMRRLVRRALGPPTPLKRTPQVAEP